MELRNAEVQKYVNIVFKRRFLFIAVSLVIMSVIICGGYLQPKKYLAESTVFIEESIIKDLVRGIAVNPSINQTVRVLKYAMLSRANVLNTLRDLDKDTEAKTKKALEGMITAYQGATKLSVRGNDLFIVSLLDTDPRFARDYINTLVRKYVEEVVTGKREDSYGANRFLNEQVSFFKKNLDEAEAAIIEFRQKQGIYVVSDEKSVIWDIKNYRQEFGSMQVRRSELASVLEKLRSQLDGVEPYTVATFRHTRGEIATSETVAYENRIEQLLTRYTENHPEVVKLQAELESLRASAEPETTEPIEDIVEPDTSAVNPLYQILEEKIYQTEAEIEALESRSARLKAMVGEKEKELKYIPESKQALAALERERDSRRELYNELLGRQGQALVSKEMEIEDKTATFKIVDPAVLPQNISSPDMKKIILMGILAGLLGGVGAVLLREQFDNSMKTVDTVKKLGIPVLGVIPRVFNEKEYSSMKKREYLVYGIAGLYFCLIGSTFLLEVLGIKHVDAFFQNLPVDQVTNVAAKAKEYIGR